MPPPVSVMPPPVSWGGRPRPPVVGKNGFFPCAQNDILVAKNFSPTKNALPRETLHKEVFSLIHFLYKN